MLHIFLTTFPFFALVLCGYAAARGGLLSLEAIPGLNSFVLFFALPCMLYRRIRWNDAAFGALVAAFPKTGFMGVPLLVALLGPRAAGPAIVTIVVDMVITTSLCIALSRLDGAGPQGARKAAFNAL